MQRSLWRTFWFKGLLVAFWLRFFPYVRMVGLNGSMVTGHAKESSDIDLFVIVRHGRIYQTRIAVMLFLTLLGLKPRVDHEAGKVCLNRLASDRFLEITPHDEYHARVFHNLIPLFSKGRTYQQFRAQNRWMKEFGYPIQNHLPVWFDTPLSFVIRGVLEVLLLPFAWGAEKVSRRWQHARVAHDPRRHRPKSVIVLSDSELRFHISK